MIIRLLVYENIFAHNPIKLLINNDADRKRTIIQVFK